MELAFTILAGLGAFLILIGYLGFVFAGFRHHFVTGIISALPVLNIVTVPALWPKAGRKVVTSILGIIIVLASWFLGANTGIPKYVGLRLKFPCQHEACIHHQSCCRMRNSSPVLQGQEGPMPRLNNHPALSMEWTQNACYL